MARNKNNGPQIAAIPKRVIEHPDFLSLSYRALRLLLQFAYQYNKRNNGKLCAIHDQLKDKGFASKQTLSEALKELHAKRFIELTKGTTTSKNGRSPNFYALTFWGIDDIAGFKMDAKPSPKPTRTFNDAIDKRNT